MVSKNKFVNLFLKYIKKISQNSVGIIANNAGIVLIIILVLSDNPLTV
jgi:hypothetical protein